MLTFTGLGDSHLENFEFYIINLILNILLDISLVHTDLGYQNIAAMTRYFALSETRSYGKAMEK